MIFLMMIFWIWPVAAAAASLGGQIYNAWQSRQNVRETHELREQLAEKQYERMQKDIKEMKRYNSPGMQMKRFEEAGLNKNLIYSQGQPGQQMNYAQYHPYEVSFHEREPWIQDVGSAIDAYQGTKQFMAEQSIRENEAEFREKLRDEGIDYEKARAELLKIRRESELTLQKQGLNEAQIQKIVREEELLEVQKAFQVIRNEFADKGVDISSGSNFALFWRIFTRMFGVEFPEKFVK